MSMLNEAILINYKHQKTYSNTALNVIGATTNQSLRTVTTYNNSNCKHVRKFGTDYNITKVTGISDPVDVKMTFKVYSAGGTLLGSRVGGGVFVAGSTVSSQGCYLKIEAAGGGSVTVPATITINTNIDAGGKIFVCTADVILSGNSLTLYLSATTSTYYDLAYRYGGKRHTPTGTVALPYFDIGTAISVLGGSFTICTVLDSETYEMESRSLSSAAFILQAALGYTPTITSGTGARATREVSVQYTNLTAVYFNNNGNDSNAGTWQAPLKTPGAAFTLGMSSIKMCVYGGDNCPGDDVYILTTMLDFTGFTTSNGDLGFEADYGYVPTMTSDTAISLVAFRTTTSTNVKYMRGFKLLSYFNNYGLIVYAVNSGVSISDNSANSIYTPGGSAANDLNIYQNVFEGKSWTLPGVLAYQSAGGKINVYKNTFKQCTFGFRFGNGNADITTTMLVYDNLFIDNVYDIYISDFQTRYITFGTSLINNNTHYDSDYGIYMTFSNASTTYATPFAERNIFYGHSVYGVFSQTKAVTINLTDFYSCAVNYNVNITSTNMNTVDPKFCDIENEMFGLSAESGLAYPTATEDYGYRRRIISIALSTINGFIFDGQNNIVNATYYQGTASSVTIKFCDFKNFAGIAVNGSQSLGVGTQTFQLLNCKIYHNGDGCRFIRGDGVYINYNLIYNNYRNGVVLGTTVYAYYLDHNTIAGNVNGINSSSQQMFVKNSIVSSNTTYGIYSATNRTLLSYTCIDDARNEALVFIDDFCFTDSALLVDLTFDSEDLNIKTIENGAVKESPAKDAADDGYDMGAILLSRAITGDFWRAHELNYNPRNIVFNSNAIGFIKFEGIVGGLDTYAKDNKLYFNFKWTNNQYSDETDRKKIQYLNGLLKRRAVETLDSETIIRLTFLNTQNLANGTGTIDNTAKTITDNSADFVEEEWRGFFIGVKYLSGTATGTISASANTLAVSGSPGWTTNQWAGYYFRYGKYWYYILSNTANTLTLSDPEDTLINASNISWTIEKYFKCSDCYQKVITVIDTADELPLGSYAYYIGFIEVRVAKPGMSYTQARYFFQQENWKTGYDIEFQEL